MRYVVIIVATLTSFNVAQAEDKFSNLLTSDFKAWRGKPKNWEEVSAVSVDAKNPRLLVGKPGEGIFLNGPKGRASNLVTKKDYQDVEVKLEFMIPKRSNSGVKFMGLYEIQILDSYGKKVKELTGSDCGGIYPRAQLRPRYKTIDKGVPPKSNACRAPGEWQTLHAIFLAPRFDGKGKKINNARIVKAVLNGATIHENIDLPHPTGHFWNTRKEIARGPVFVQADHGPIAFRKILVREYEAQK